MKTKIVIWGVNEQEERVLIALRLRPEESKIDIWTFPEKVVTEEFSQKMMREWRNGAEVEFPEEKTHQERALSVTEGLLPDDLKVERGDIVNRAQTEWHFVVLSSKLNQVYKDELAELKEKIEGLEDYDQKVWDNLKEFWNKVQEQVRDRNLFRGHADSLRDNTNALFTQLKALRSKLDEEFAGRSKEQLQNFLKSLEEIEQKISEGVRLHPIFEELKKMQRNFREVKMTREDRGKLWDRLDAAFKTVKQKRFGAGAIMDNSPMQRLQRRYNGLVTAIEKMDRSIKRDIEDLDFQKRKIATTDGQLEAQIRQAKIVMIEERVNSKTEKLKEMLATKVDLEQKIEVQKEKEAQRAERDAREAAKVAAKEKIAEEIKAAAAAREGEPEAEAPEAVVETAEEPAAAEPEAAPESAEEEKKEEDSLTEAVSATLGETLGDAVDTVKAVAEVVGDKIEEAVDDLKDKLTGDKEEETEAAPENAEEEKKEEDSLTDAVSATLGETLEDVVDTVKAVAEVVGDKIEEAVEDLKDKITGEDEEEKAETASEEKSEVSSSDKEE